MTIFQKREKFLKSLNSLPYLRQAEKFFLNKGKNFSKKIKRFLFSPSIYLRYLLWRMGFYKKSTKVKLFFNREIYLPPIDTNAFFLHLFGALAHPMEIKLTKFFIKNFKQNDIFYDVGANWGFYTYLSLEFCKEVHLFEPLPQLFENLKQNLLNEKKCFLNNCALSNYNGFSKLYVGKDYSAISTLREEVFQKSKELFKDEILVKTITLDEYIKTHNPPTFIKLDVEGVEDLVIEGGMNLLTKFSPIVAVEIWPKNLDLEGFHQKAIRLMKKIGYQIFFINPDGELKAIKKVIGGDNFIFTKKNIW